MIEWIKKNKARVWRPSTVYNLLKKGKDSGRYVNHENKWRLASSDELFGKKSQWTP